MISRNNIVVISHMVVARKIMQYGTRRRGRCMGNIHYTYIYA
jgi:hypothetical protein